MLEWTEPIAALVGVAATVVTVFRWFRYRRKVTATATLVEMRVIPGLRDSIHNALIRPENILIMKKVDDLLDIANQYKFFWTFRIANRGRKEVKALTLHLPFRGHFEIKDAPVAVNFQDTILLGDMRSGVTKQIYVWTDSGLSFDGEKEIRVTYADDVIPVQINRNVYGRFGLFAQFVQEYQGLMLFIISMIFVYLVLEVSRNVVFIRATPPTPPSSTLTTKP